MKPVFKTTALAILVGLGVTACKSNDEHKPAPTPSSANQQANQSQVNQTQTNNGNVEKEKAESEKKAKEAAELKAKEEAEKARLEAEKKAKEAEQARLEAERKAKEAAALKAKQEAEKVANEWRGSASNANIVEPETRNSYSKTVYPELPYVDSYDGTQDNAPIRDWTNRGYKLNYYQLSVNDKNNPQLLGWHKGEIKSAGINGSQISKINETGEITERTYPEKVDYYFKNTPYSTYGAVYNNYEANLFANFEKASSISTNDNTYQIGEYEVIDGNKTTKIKYNDSVKGSATYKGEVLAVASRRTSNEYNAYELADKLPTVDGTIAIVANFGPREEENFASATLDSKVLGKVEFPKTRMSLNDTGIEYNTSSTSKNINEYDPVHLKSTVVGKEANEIVGKIDVRNTYTKKIGDVKEYNAVFVAEKQPK